MDCSGVLGRGRHVDQILDTGDIEIDLELALLGGGRDGDLQPGIMHATQQLWHRREWPHQGQVLRFEQLAAPFLHLLTMILLFGLGEEHGNQLVTALTDLATSLFEGHMVAELDQRLLPRARV